MNTIATVSTNKAKVCQCNVNEKKCWAIAYRSRQRRRWLRGRQRSYDVEKSRWMANATHIALTKPSQQYYVYFCSTYLDIFLQLALASLCR